MTPLAACAAVEVRRSRQVLSFSKPVAVKDFAENLFARLTFPGGCELNLVRSYSADREPTMRRACCHRRSGAAMSDVSSTGRPPPPAAEHGERYLRYKRPNPVTRRALGAQLGDRGIDTGAGETVDVEAFHDLAVAVDGTPRK